VGQNDAITWPEFEGLLSGGDPGAVERHLAYLRRSGITILRMMLEYCEHGSAFLESPAGEFNETLARVWDDLVAACRRHGLRLLLTPFDTYFTWTRWDAHPYNRANGGPCAGRDRLLTCLVTRAFIKRRLEFATRRWGGDGVIFAWDLWNELHPAQGENHPTCFEDFIGDVGPWLRELEHELHGRVHLQTVSVFGPELQWKPWLNQPIFRHPGLDFASSHFYEEGTIDFPADTVGPAISVGRLVREALAEIGDSRPFLDSEHGPIHTFKDHGITLPEPFDDEYFRHLQWAHLASGGAGGGMRWPNRHPHLLTVGMRRSQRALADFLPLIDWTDFRRQPLLEQVAVDEPAVHLFACGDGRQAVLYLLRTDAIDASGMIDRRAPELAPTVTLPDMAPGLYQVVSWDTRSGRQDEARWLAHRGGALPVRVDRLAGDLAIAVRLIPD
jgi:mannan endo-1,4-beta-mannosidase